MAPVVHHRTVDTLGIMLRAGTITKDMHDAARDFQAQFTIARFDAVVCMPLCGCRVEGPADLTDAQVDARRRVGAALDALGGLGSPAGGCVWHVVGLQRSIREWAMRQGWGGRPVRSSRRRESWWRRWGCWRLLWVRTRLICLHRVSQPVYPIFDRSAASLAHVRYTAIIDQAAFKPHGRTCRVSGFMKSQNSPTNEPAVARRGLLHERIDEAGGAG